MSAGGARSFPSSVSARSNASAYSRSRMRRILCRMTAASSKVLDTAAMDWRDFDEAPGVAYKVLRTHKPGTGLTLMLRFAPNATYPAHRHPQGEEYYVLEGELVDGERAYG